MPQSDVVPDFACPTQNALTRVAELRGPIPGRGVGCIYDTPRARVSASMSARVSRGNHPPRTITPAGFADHGQDADADERDVPGGGRDGRFRGRLSAREQ